MGVCVLGGEGGEVTKVYEIPQSVKRGRQGCVCVCGGCVCVCGGGSDKGL